MLIAGSLLIDLQEWYRSTNNIDPMVQALFTVCAHDLDLIPKDQNYWFLVIKSTIFYTALKSGIFTTEKKHAKF